MKKNTKLTKKSIKKTTDSIIIYVTQNEYGILEVVSSKYDLCYDHEAIVHEFELEIPKVQMSVKKITKLVPKVE